MRGTPDISTVELSRTKLKLRDDLLFVPQQYEGETYYHVEVKTSSEYYRIGYAEYVFVSLLDGHTSFSEALAIASRQLQDKALSQTQAMSIYSWLLDNGLAAFTDTDTAASGALSAARRPNKPGSFWTRFNPLWLKIPFGRPDAILKFLTPLLGWAFSVPATCAAILLMVTAMAALRSHWAEFTATSASVIAMENWFWLLVVWIVLKFAHEIGHGLVCHRYGGSIRETGVVIAFLAPLAYVDASSCWAFRSRWQRIHTAMAGIYVELVIASVAILAWTQIESPVARHIFQNIIMMASVSTLLFNLNPLMKFDGYYVLSDLLKIPNLSSRASTALSSLIRRIFCGDGHGAASIEGHRKWLLLTYGVLAAAWRLLVSLSLLLMASVLFHGAGIVLAALGVILWFGKPLWNLACETVRLWRQHPEGVLRAGLCCGALGIIVAGALIGLPSPGLKTAPGIVDFSGGEVVRPETAGFVERVYVRNGQHVSEGDLLMSLRNEDVLIRLHDVERQLAQEELRGQTASGEHDSGALNVSQGNRNSLLRQLAECREQADALQIRASRSGYVVSRHLEQMPGTFVRAGTELMTIGEETEKELQVSVGQRDFPLSASMVGQELKVRIGTHRAITGILVRVNPGASRSIPHPALAAVNGGPLPVAESENKEQQDRLRLTEYRFTAVVQLPENEAARFRSGERGVVVLGLSQGSLGRQLWRAAHDWMTQQLKNIRKTNASAV